MERMKGRISILFSWAIAAGLLIGIAPGARAGDKGCTNSTLNGSYGFYRTGTTGANTASLAAVGIITFYGDGTASSTQSISETWTLQFDISSGTTYYALDSDCTGKQYFDAAQTLEVSRIVVVDDGSSYFGLSENQGNAVYRWGRRSASTERPEGRRWPLASRPLRCRRGTRPRAGRTGRRPGDRGRCVWALSERRRELPHDLPRRLDGRDRRDALAGLPAVRRRRALHRSPAQPERRAQRVPARGSSASSGAP